MDFGNTLGMIVPEVYTMSEDKSVRQLHIRVPLWLHRALRLPAAADDRTIQDVVVSVLTRQFAGGQDSAVEPEEDGDGD